MSSSTKRGRRASSRRAASRRPSMADLLRVQSDFASALRDVAAPPLDAAALAAVAPGRQGALRFVLADGCALVESAHPVLRVWQIHQPGFEGEFGVDWTTSECALVAREGLRVGASALAAGE